MNEGRLTTIGQLNQSRLEARGTGVLTGVRQQGKSSILRVERPRGGTSARTPGVENQKGRVFGPALLTENNVKIFSVDQSLAAVIAFDTPSATPHIALSTMENIQHPRKWESHQNW